MRLSIHVCAFLCLPLLVYACLCVYMRARSSKMLMAINEFNRKIFVQLICDLFCILSWHFFFCCNDLCKQACHKKINKNKKTKPKCNNEVGEKVSVFAAFLALFGFVFSSHFLIFYFFFHFALFCLAWLCLKCFFSLGRNEKQKKKTEKNAKSKKKARKMLQLICFFSKPNTEGGRVAGEALGGGCTKRNKQKKKIGKKNTFRNFQLCTSKC